MTGSEHSSNSPSKSSKHPSTNRQQQHEGCKTDHQATTDKLRRLAIKNSYGNKSIQPGSPLPSRASSSISSLNSLSSAPSIIKSAESTAAMERQDCKLPPAPSTITAATDKLQIPGQSSSQSHVPGEKYSPYITRQELLHSLRRTSSSLSVGITQTMCSRSSSYIHHTPRHLTRTDFNPRPAIACSAAVTPDSGLGKSELALREDEENEDCDGDGHEKDETRSMVEFPPHRLAPNSCRGPMRGCRDISPLRTGRLHYVSVELPTIVDSRHDQVSGMGCCLHAHVHVLYLYSVWMRIYMPC